MDHEVRFVVCGGVACFLQGVERTTVDLDIAVELTDENLSRVIAVARDLGLQPRIPEPLEAILDGERRRMWIEEKGARVFTLLSPNSPVQLDVFLTYPIPYGELKAGADRMEIGEREVLVSARRDLLRAKQAVNPPRRIDVRDIEDLKELIKRERETRQ